MRVGVDETRYQDMRGAFNEHAGLKSGLCFCCGQHSRNVPIREGDSMVLQYLACVRNWYAPAG